MPNPIRFSAVPICRVPLLTASDGDGRKQRLTMGFVWRLLPGEEDAFKPTLQKWEAIFAKKPKAERTDIMNHLTTLVDHAKAAQEHVKIYTLQLGKKHQQDLLGIAMLHPVSNHLFAIQTKPPEPEKPFYHGIGRWLLGGMMIDLKRQGQLKPLTFQPTPESLGFYRHVFEKLPRPEYEEFNRNKPEDPRNVDEVQVLTTGITHWLDSLRNRPDFQWLRSRVRKHQGKRGPRSQPEP